jgi:uncharacterized membrane protein YciS (DUF1049 family)
MKKFKAIVWLIIIGLLGTVVYQNKGFFLTRESLSIDLIYSRYQSPELPAVLFFAAFFLLGWLIAYLFGILDRYRAAKTIKALHQTMNTQQHAIDDMKKDVEALKPRLQPDEKSQTQQPTEADIANA